MKPRGIAWLRPLVRLSPVTGTLAIALGACAVAFPINLLLGQVSLSRVFLVAVLISGITYGLWPSLFASLMTVLIYDFFFLPPVYSLTVASSQDLLNLILFGITAVIVSTLAARVRRYAITADKRALTAEKLAAFNRRVAACVTLPDVLDTATEQMAALLHRPVALLLSDAGHPTISHCHPPHALPDTASLAALAEQWPTLLSGPGNARVACGKWAFLQLPTRDAPNTVVGVQALHSPLGTDSEPRLDDPLFVSLTENMALAIERQAVRERLEDSRIHAEAERLRSALLVSISHDMRNPLAAIVGSASGLDRQWDALGDAAKRALLHTIRTEAERLDLFIANLLDITRIEAGVVRPRREPAYLSDVLGTALDQATRILADHRVTIDMPSDLPLVEVDTGLLQQVLYNVIENAAKYSPIASRISITARSLEGFVELHILDEGPGVPDEERELVFEKFYRAKNVPRQSGTGLGLAICRGFLNAMRGTIDMNNRRDQHGTVVAITLPIASQQVLCELEIS
jgi:two-component system, OmpR family, sensor histidine kinase KdpD